jgi:hypothetical protein
MTAKVRFGRDDANEHRFDFTFEALTQEPAAPTSIPQAAKAAPVTAPAPAASAPPATSQPDVASDMPLTMAGIVSELQRKDTEVRELIARGDFAAVWVPAFAAKDLAISLEPHLAHLQAAKRDVGEPALARVVRGAWLLDAAGDVGNRQQIEAAYSTFSAGVADVVAAFR